MSQNVPLAYEDQVPEEFFDATQEMLSGAEINLFVTLLNATTIRVPAGPGDAEASISIGGAYRYVSANVDRAHPGGAAGTYDVYATSAANQAAPNYGPPNGDHSFALAIVPTGQAPGAAISTRIRTLQWDGAAITRIDRLDPERPVSHAAAHAVGGADPLTPAAIGAPTSAAPVFTGTSTFNGPITLNGDTQIARAAAGVLSLPAVQGSGQFVAQIGQVGQTILGPSASQGGLVLGSAQDTSLQRQSAGVLYTPGALTVAGALSGGVATVSSLSTAGQITVTGSATYVARSFSTATSAVMVTKVAGDAYDRFTINADGGLNWGGATAAADTSLYRQGPGNLRMNGRLDADYAVVWNGAAGRIGLGAAAGTTAATIFFGQNSDVTLTRSGSASLSVTGSLRVAGGLYVGPEGTSPNWVYDGNLNPGAMRLNGDLWVTGGSTNASIYGVQTGGITLYRSGGEHRFVNFGNGAFQSVTGGAYTNASDARIKDNVRDIEGDAIVRALRPRSFTLRGAHDDGNGVHLGFVAQEVREVVPEAVNIMGSVGAIDDFLGLDSSALIAPVVSALQRTIDRLDALEALAA